MLEEEIGTKLRVNVPGKCVEHGVLCETIGCVPLRLHPIRIATEKTKRGVNGVCGNRSDGSGSGEQENFIGGGIADGWKFFEGFLGFGQRTLEDGAHVAGKFVEDTRGDFLQAKRGEFRLHNAGAHDFAKFRVGGVENFLRSEADFVFQGAETFVAAFVGLRIAAIAMEEHFVGIDRRRRLGFSFQRRQMVELVEAIEDRGKASGLSVSFGH